MGAWRAGASVRVSVHAIRCRSALGDHPGVHVGAVDAAHRDERAVAVAVTLGTLNRPAGDALAKRSGVRHEIPPSTW